VSEAWRRSSHEGFGQGLVKGLASTLRTMLHRSVTVQYPHVQPTSGRSRGVIAPKQENARSATSARASAPLCIYIDAHKETHEPAGGGRARSAKTPRSVRDRLRALHVLRDLRRSLPFDALFWSREFDYAGTDIHELTHEKERLEEWTYHRAARGRSSKRAPKRRRRSRRERDEYASWRRHDRVDRGAWRSSNRPQRRARSPVLV